MGERMGIDYRHFAKYVEDCIPEHIDKMNVIIGMGILQSYLDDIVAISKKTDNSELIEICKKIGIWEK